MGLTISNSLGASAQTGGDSVMAADDTHVPESFHPSLLPHNLKGRELLALRFG